MDTPTRSALERATQRARRLLEGDFSSQLEGTFDILRTGAIADSPGAHLSPAERVGRDKIVAAIEHKSAAGMSREQAIADYVRDSAFTMLNRVVALKMLEARELVQPCISQGEQSSGYREYIGLAPGIALLPDGAGYRLYIESLFDELSTEIKVLFDRQDPASVLWPKRASFEELFEIVNARELQSVWGEDETIGWVYQYFNLGEERQAMRAASQAPRNTRELAVRNQFFTPRYVVQFLVDNTLGRTWYEMRGTQTVLAEECEYMVRGANDVPRSPLEDVDDDEAWLSEVAAGKWSAIPEDFSWEQSASFAHLIDGYELARTLGLGDAGDFANGRRRLAEQFNLWEGTALELWICLFFEHRSYRHTGYDPQARSLELLNGLCQSLRTALIEEEKAGRAPKFFVEREKKDPRDLRVLDPACGSGHFLLYAFDLLVAIYEEAQGDPEGPESEATGRTLAEDYPSLDALRKAIPGLILEKNLHGVDIDPRCAQIAQLALWMRAQRSYRDFGISRADRALIKRSNIVIAESMPNDAHFVDAFATTLEPPLLGELFKKIVGEMRLAGELGLLLKVEKAIEGEVRRAREQFGTRQRELAKGYLPGFEVLANKQPELDFSGIDDARFFEEAEHRILAALQTFTGSAGGHQAIRRRLFAGDAAQGLGLVEMARSKFDVVLMNPPFGAGSLRAKRDFEKAYPKTKNDVYAAFVERGIELLRPRGRLGAITSRTGFFLSSFQKWREEILLEKAPPVVFADLGYGVLDSAMVETAAYCLEVKA